MAAMKDLHIEYGMLVYQADVENTISRMRLLEKREEIVERFLEDGIPARTTLGLLDDIADDVEGNPEKWSGYSITGNLPAHIQQLVNA